MKSPTELQEIMFEVFDYAKISDGIDRAEGLAREEQKLCMEGQAGKIRAMLSEQGGSGWRCFHCGEYFTDTASAELHFGKHEMRSPACTIDIAEYRAMEARMESYSNENTELHRDMYAMMGRHRQELIREEEKGYATGLKDGRKEALADAEADIARLHREKMELVFKYVARAPIEDEKFVRAWLQLDKLPGGMMHSSIGGRFGPVGASTSCWITTSEAEVELLRREGKPVLEVWTK